MKTGVNHEPNKGQALILSAFVMVVIYLTPPIFSQLVLAALIIPPIYRRAKFWKFPHWMGENERYNNNKKGGEPKW